MPKCFLHIEISAFNLNFLHLFFLILYYLVEFFLLQRFLRSIQQMLCTSCVQPGSSHLAMQLSSGSVSNARIFIFIALRWFNIIEEYLGLCTCTCLTNIVDSAIDNMCRRPAGVLGQQRWPAFCLDWGPQQWTRRSCNHAQ